MEQLTTGFRDHQTVGAQPAKQQSIAPHPSVRDKHVCALPFPHTRNLLLMRDLSAEDVLVLESLRVQKSHGVGALLPEHPMFIVSGWAMRVRIFRDGRRQILSFALPGDPVQSVQGPSVLDNESGVALTPLVTVSAASIIDSFLITDRASGIATALARTREKEFARLLNNITRLGCMSALERVGNLLLELHARLLRIGEASATECAFPLTQEVLADATGLSVVHANRTLQRLRAERLAVLSRGRLRILDFEKLARISDYRVQDTNGQSGVTTEVAHTKSHY